MSSTAVRSLFSTAPISPTRSSWSLDKFSRTITAGRVSRATRGKCISSTSNTAKGALAPIMAAVVIPGPMLSPPKLAATSPRVDNAAAVIFVVVDFPLVPVTKTTCLSRVSVARISGSNFRATLPPTMPPSPLPRSREATLAPNPTNIAVLAFNDTVRLIRCPPRWRRQRVRSGQRTACTTSKTGEVQPSQSNCS